MQLLDSFHLNENPVYFAYRRTSTFEDKFRGIFHVHQGLEFLYIHEGAGTIIVEQETYNITPETLFIFQPYKLHQLSIDITDEKPFIRSILLFEPSVFNTYLEKFPTLRLFFQKICENELPNKAFFVNQQEMENLFKYHHNIQARHEKDFPLEEHALFIISMLRCVKNIVSTSDDKSMNRLRKTHRAEQIMEWIDQNLMNNFQLEDISQELHLSTYYISHLFKEATGSTIKDYLNAKRIQQACLLLATSDKSISQISEEIGLLTTSYFCQLFKKHTGYSPYKYRTHLKKRNN